MITIQYIARLIGTVLAVGSILPSSYMTFQLLRRVVHPDLKTNRLTDIVLLVLFLFVIFASFVYGSIAISLIVDTDFNPAGQYFITISQTVGQFLIFVFTWGMYYIARQEIEVID